MDLCLGKGHGSGPTSRSISSLDLGKMTRDEKTRSQPTTTRYVNSSGKNVL